VKTLFPPSSSVSSQQPGALPELDRHLGAVAERDPLLGRALAALATQLDYKRLLKLLT